MKLNSLFIGSFLFLLIISCQQEVIVYVDHSAEKQAIANGSIKHPYPDFDTAFRIVGELRGKGNKNHIKIILRKGTYSFDKGYLIQSDLSNFTIAAYPGEEVVFSGGKPIPLHLVQEDKIGNSSVQQVDLKQANIHDYGTIGNIGFSRPYQIASWAELFINTKPMRLSRWPNQGTIRMGKVLDEGSVPRNNDFSNRGAVMAYDSIRISSWEFTEDMWISGYFKYGYADDALRIAQLDKTQKTITTDGPTLYGFYSGYDWNQWYAFNIKEETDEAGEYYLERSTGKLYFIAPDNEISSMYLSELNEPFFDIWQTRNIQIEGIIFEYSRAAILTLNEAENVHIKNCTFRNSGSIAIINGLGIEPFKDYLHEGTGTPTRHTVGSLQQHLYTNQTFNRKGGQNNTIENCRFYNLGAGAISLGGGNRLTLVPGNNVVKNCIFYDNNRIEQSYRPAIHITGVGNKIQNCEIYNSPSMAILLHGNNHLIENNYIHDVCLDVEDQGAFYYGRNPSECGTILRNNLFANIPDTYATCAVYHDDGAGGLTVENNIFYKAGKFASLLGGGSDNVYRNNVFINGQIGIHTDKRLQNWAKSLIEEGGLFEHRLKEVNYKVAPYLSAYPYLSDYIPHDSLPKRNIISNNYFIGIRQHSDAPSLLIWDNNVFDEKKIEIIPYSKDELLKRITETGIRSTPENNPIGITPY